MFNKVLPKITTSSTDSICFEVPEKLIINEDAKTIYSTSQKIETLIQELKEKGPLVAFGYMGPKCYDSEPSPAKKFGSVEPFGWKVGTRSQSKTEQTYAIVIGAKKEGEQELVYFRLSYDCTFNTRSYMREHRPTADSRVFVSSHKTFKEYLVDLYPAVAADKPAEEKTSTNFIASASLYSSSKELEYLEKLATIMPLDSVLGENEAACKALGQEIFDYFKSANHNSSSAGREAVVKICEQILYCAKDGHLRKQYIERAWDGIGDSHWSWRR